MFFSLSSEFLKHNNILIILIPILPFVYIHFFISFFVVGFLAFVFKMPAEGVAIVEEPVLCGSPMGSPSPTSPKNRIKFLCSHGGKILPQPADGHLKYVGGETRVISVHRDIKLSGKYILFQKFYASNCLFNYLYEYVTLHPELI